MHIANAGREPFIFCKWRSHDIINHFEIAVVLDIILLLQNVPKRITGTDAVQPKFSGITGFCLNQNHVMTDDLPLEGQWIRRVKFCLTNVMKVQEQNHANDANRTPKCILNFTS